ncbi:hypothetical protein KC19_VG049100 [Ceratodon purpureus]|uniref:Uncharacterized protein n=1 Tax=Ceratodon purpureus TaxID=3225 RepID=A0A8T0HM48_CERPU|nr:hypothetical protein KC19_VG049100 [Ceratodon purpureus]
MAHVHRRRPLNIKNPTFQLKNPAAFEVEQVIAQRDPVHGEPHVQCLRSSRHQKRIDSVPIIPNEVSRHRNHLLSFEVPLHAFHPASISREELPHAQRSVERAILLVHTIFLLVEGVEAPEHNPEDENPRRGLLGPAHGRRCLQRK